MDVSLNKKNALITGGSLGLGKAVAREFVKSGANVAIVARDKIRLEKAKNEFLEIAKNKVKIISADVRLAKDCLYCAEEVKNTFGHIDILVNNAGTSKRGPFLEVTDEVWQDDLDLKLFAAIRLCRLFIPEMKKRRWGRIINVLNIGAKTPTAEGAPTAVSRAAGMALMKVLANEGAPYNILVNAMLVGKIRSDQWKRRHKANPDGLNLEEWYQKAGKDQPLGRLGLPEEFAHLACFLASDKSSYINGAAINIDGGLCPQV